MADDKHWLDKQVERARAHRAANMAPDLRPHVCSCQVTNHPLHRPSECDEPPMYVGGVCRTCQYANSPAYRTPEGHV